MQTHNFFLAGKSALVIRKLYNIPSRTLFDRAKKLGIVSHKAKEQSKKQKCTKDYLEQESGHSSRLVRQSVLPDMVIVNEVKIEDEKDDYDDDDIKSLMIDENPVPVSSSCPPLSFPQPKIKPSPTDLMLCRFNQL